MASLSCPTTSTTTTVNGGIFRRHRPPDPHSSRLLLFVSCPSRSERLFCSTSSLTTAAAATTSSKHSGLSSMHLQRSFLSLFSHPSRCIQRCRAASPGAPPPGPPDEDKTSFGGTSATLLNLRDTVQIFFAVLFWMSLFFWACAFDQRNNGKRDKGSRLRR